MGFWKNVWNKIRRKTKEEAEKVWDWWKKTGRPAVEDAFKGVAGILWNTYQKQILQIILDIAKKLMNGELPKDKKELEIVFAQQLKEVLDRNKDGKITWEDVPDGVVKFLQEWAVRLFKSLGDSDGVRIKALENLLNSE